MLCSFRQSPVVEIGVDQSVYIVQENQSPLTICITLTDTTIERNLVVTLSTSDSTAQGMHTASIQWFAHTAVQSNGVMDDSFQAFVSNI